MHVSDVDGADAVVRGEPADLLLWLWNRADDDAVTVTGDPTCRSPPRGPAAAACAGDRGAS